MIDQSARNDWEKATEVGQLFTPKYVAEFFGILKLFTIFFGWLSLSAEIFIRRSFGERYLSLLRIALAWLTFQVFRSLYYLIGGTLNLIREFSILSPPNFSNFLANTPANRFYVVFVVAFWVLCLLHLLTIWRRNANGVLWHSNSFGQSWLQYLPWKAWDKVVAKLPSRTLHEALRVNDWKLYCFVEPFVCFAAATVIGLFFDSFMGTWLKIASVTLLFKNTALYYDLRGRILDMVDAQIESKYFQPAMQGEDKSKTAGFSVIPAAAYAAASEKKMNIDATVKETLQPTTADPA